MYGGYGDKGEGIGGRDVSKGAGAGRGESMGGPSLGGGGGGASGAGAGRGTSAGGPSLGGGGGAGPGRGTSAGGPSVSGGGGAGPGRGSTAGGREISGGGQVGGGLGREGGAGPGRGSSAGGREISSTAGPGRGSSAGGREISAGGRVGGGLGDRTRMGEVEYGGRPGTSTAGPGRGVSPGGPIGGAREREIATGFDLAGRSQLGGISYGGTEEMPGRGTSIGGPDIRGGLGTPLGDAARRADLASQARAAENLSMDTYGRAAAVTAANAQRAGLAQQARASEIASMRDLGALTKSYRDAIKGRETEGVADPYSTVHPGVKRKDGTTTNAYGAYGIMEDNIGPWSKEVLGKEMTPKEFLANPAAQDKIFDAKIGGMVAKHGSFEAAAQEWYGGPTAVGKPGRAPPAGGPSVGEYAADALGRQVNAYAANKAAAAQAAQPAVAATERPGFAVSGPVTPAGMAVPEMRAAPSPPDLVASPKAQFTASPGFVSPTSDVVDRVTAAWASVLGADNVRITGTPHGGLRTSKKGASSGRHGPVEGQALDYSVEVKTDKGWRSLDFGSPADRALADKVAVAGARDFGLMGYGVGNGYMSNKAIHHDVVANPKTGAYEWTGPQARSAGVPAETKAALAEARRSYATAAKTEPISGRTAMETPVASLMASAADLTPQMSALNQMSTAQAATEPAAAPAQPARTTATGTQPALPSRAPKPTSRNAPAYQRTGFGQAIATGIDVLSGLAPGVGTAATIANTIAMLTGKRTGGERVVDYIAQNPNAYNPGEWDTGKEGRNAAAERAEAKRRAEQGKATTTVPKTTTFEEKYLFSDTTVRPTPEQKWDWASGQYVGVT